MEWVFASLIVGAVIYAGTIAIDYFNYSSQIQPRISDLDRDVEDLSETVGAEEAQQLELQDRIEALNGSVESLQCDIAETRGRIQAERVRKQRLEMAFFKHRLKKRQPAVLV